MTFDDLDFITIGIRDKEKPRKQVAARTEDHDITGGKTQRLDACMLCIQVVDAHGDVPVTTAMRIRLFFIVIQCQLNLEVIFSVAQVDQRKPFELMPALFIQVESPGIKIDRRVQVQDTDHGMDDFGHCCNEGFRALAPKAHLQAEELRIQFRHGFPEFFQFRPGAVNFQTGDGGYFQRFLE